MSASKDMINISNAWLLTSEATGPEAKALQVWREELYKRSELELPHYEQWPVDDLSDQPILIMGTITNLKPRLHDFPELITEANSLQKEGYLLKIVQKQQPIVAVIGADARGVLYGIGRLLRKMHMKPGIALVPGGLSIISHPAAALRGHQLGYRPKTNAYDAWAPAQFDQYIRELALFGANSIELLPPRTDDAPSSPVMKYDPLDMMVALSQTISDYGLDVWVWYPNMADSYDNPETLQAEIRERETIFSKLPRIDHVMIPGGDPGDLEPELLFKWSEQVAHLLHKYHPHALLWISPQCFEPTQEWVNHFYEQVRKEPEWLGGIVHGPWERISIKDLRRIIPEKYPIRNYPDITHNYTCQYPVPDWDLAFAMTQGRECVNPRPRAFKHIHNQTVQYSIGSLCYSEGIYDDVNKFVWSDQDWDAATPVMDTLRDYVRFFIGPDYTEELAVGLMGLERNWEGPLAVNTEIEKTLERWLRAERNEPARLNTNYRFQMGLLRACYDAFLQKRWCYENELERKALDTLRKAPEYGTQDAVELAEHFLTLAVKEPAASELREKCLAIADSLFHFIGAQTTVARHHAQSWSRGAFLEDIDTPLNNAAWILQQCGLAKKMEHEQDRLLAVCQICNRTDPGPGGYYDHLGSPSGAKRIVRRRSWTEDPEFFESPLIGYATTFLHLNEEEREKVGAVPLAWIGQATTHYSEPLKLRYEHLDPGKSYKLKVTYAGYLWGIWSKSFDLQAGDGTVLHEELEVHRKILQPEFNIPVSAYKTGSLELIWSSKDGCLGPFVAEAWLISSDR